MAPPLRPFDRAVADVGPAGAAAGTGATAHRRRRTKPRGSLGRLEDAGARVVVDVGVAGPVPPAPVLGEGTGACLALPLLQAAALVLREMATFAGAGVTGKE